ncbi:MAG TPA: MgtC/SapB family protein, partial [Haloplasmataceae bacterium]
KGRMRVSGFLAQYEHELEIVIKLLFSFIVGGIIGFEREKLKKPVGFRTYVLVCLGSTVVTIVGLETVDYTIKIAMQNPDLLKDVIKVDTVRLTAQVVSGIGFIGAGAIINHKSNVTGLTSAASIWTASMIGIAIGYGYYFLASVATLLVLLALLLSTFKHYYEQSQEEEL